MKKIKSSLIGGLFSLLLLFPAIKDTDLKDIAKPYLGVYECTQAHLGSLDCLEGFTDISLELKDEENFLLFYKEKGSARKKIEGKYHYDRERKVLTLVDERVGFTREFPFTDGKLTVSFPVGSKMLVLQFERK